MRFTGEPKRVPRDFAHGSGGDGGRLAAMKKLTGKKAMIMQPFQTGQVWQIEGAHLRIKHVGKTLVHYKLLKGEIGRGPLLLKGKTGFEEFLRANKAVLLQ
jgi:hypothetical protein